MTTQAHPVPMTWVFPTMYVFFGVAMWAYAYYLLPGGEWWYLALVIGVYGPGLLGLLVPSRKFRKKSLRMLGYAVAGFLVYLGLATAASIAALIMAPLFIVGVLAMFSAIDRIS